MWFSSACTNMGQQACADMDFSWLRTHFEPPPHEFVLIIAHPCQSVDTRRGIFQQEGESEFLLSLLPNTSPWGGLEKDWETGISAIDNLAFKR